MSDFTPAAQPPTDAFFRAVIDSSSDAIISQDLNGTITSWNKAAERIFGHAAPEAAGRPITLLVPPDRSAEELDIMARIRQGEQIESYETVRQRKDGRFIDIALTVSPIVGTTGQVIGASTIARDISAQKHEQEHWRVTLASIGDAVLTTDTTGRVRFLNPTAERLTGWTYPDAIGQPLDAIFQIVREGDSRRANSPVERVLREGCVAELENHTLLIAKDKSAHPIDDSAAPIRDRHGNLLGVVLVFRDVTAHRDAELAALRLAAIIAGSDDAIVSKDLHGIVTGWNPAAERIFGYTADEMIGRSITRVIPPERIDEENQILARLRRGERLDHFQTLRRRKDGELIHVSLTISPIKDKDGRIIGASKIARDITGLKHAEERLQAHAAELEQKVCERTAKLQEMVNELEAFSYSLSHDMRAPLRAIQSFTEIVIADYGEKIPEGIDYLNRVIGAANRMDRLIREVLDFARVSRTDIELVPVPVEHLVDEIVKERPELQSPRVQITTAKPLFPVIGHEASLTQCLTNLLDNAAKFVEPGKQPIIRVFTEEVDGKVRICVRDNGIGIDAEAQQRLFGIFQRLHTVRSYQGTGVGLAIVRNAAERMNGRVGVESSPGLGSTFWIELPKAQA